MEVYKNMNERKWKKKIRIKEEKIKLNNKLRKTKCEKNITFWFFNQSNLTQILVRDEVFNKMTFDMNTELQ